MENEQRRLRAMAEASASPLPLSAAKVTKLKKIGELILILNIIKILVVYGYFFQKDWAIKVGITDAILGIFLCIIVFIISISQSNLNFPIQGVILLIYLVSLRSIRLKWESIKI